MRCKSCNHTNPIHAIRKMETDRYNDRACWALVCEKCGRSEEFETPVSPSERLLDKTTR